ncbi:hypothetical protein [Longispora urticae]
MSTTWVSNDQDDDDENEGQGKKPSGLRAHASKLEEANKAHLAEIAALKTEVRNTNLANILKEKGLDPKVGGLVPKDIEPTPEALGKWVEEYGSLFGKPAEPAPVADAAQPPAPPQADPAFDVFQTQMDRMNNAIANTAGAVSPEADLMAKLSGAKDQRELDALIRNSGPAGRFN